MGKQYASLNDDAWVRLFERYDILRYIEENGEFRISAKQIKEEREPRLMAKFDHAINLPDIFRRNKLTILPITRGDYVISHFDAYHTFEHEDTPIQRVSLPTYLQSIDGNNISSESIALNCAVAAGIVKVFLGDEEILSTVSGRMGSGEFDFRIRNLKSEELCNVQVRNSQIEIDAAYEGICSLALFEAKRDISADFLVRQLYYPYRVWRKRITKPVRPIFLVYSNGIYHIYEYTFENPEIYSSILLIKQQRYTVEDISITAEDIQHSLRTVVPEEEPEVPFPQANSFARVINLCELLAEQRLSRDEVTERYAFDARQTNYYTDAARYLGLIEKKTVDGIRYYELSKRGQRILRMGYRERQIAYCSCILSHRIFASVLSRYFQTGAMPETNDIVQMMKRSNLYHVVTENTYERRSSTIKGWINWIIGLINE